MERDLRHGLMAQDIMVNMYKVKNMEKENSHGPMEVHTMASSLKITSKVKENIIGLTVVNMMDSGRIIRWKVMVFSHGLTEDVTRVPMSTIRKKVKATFTGRMAVSTRADGKMESNMVSVLIHLQVVKLNKENGLMVRDSIGSLTLKEINDRRLNSSKILCFTAIYTSL